VESANKTEPETLPDLETEPLIPTTVAESEVDLEHTAQLPAEPESDLEMQATPDLELETAQAVELEPEPEPEVELESTLELEAEAETETQAEILAPEDEGAVNKPPDEAVATEQELKLESDTDTDTDTESESGDVANDGQPGNDKGTPTHD